MTDAKQFVAGARSLSEALTRLADHYGSNGEFVAFFGFYAHLEALEANDFIFEFSHKSEYDDLNVKDVYMSVGGAREDFYAPTIPGTAAVIEVVLPELLAAFEAQNDRRANFVKLLMNLGIHRGWMAPIHASWLGGYGTLNFFHHDSDGISPLASDEHLKLACLLYTSPSPRDQRGSRMPSSA